MKISKLLSLIPALITIVLFIIPFFWLKPGEMDLGGDGNRLYFYDPLSYLKAHSPYNVIPSGIGGNAISYYALPFIVIILLLRFISSATFVISLINGLKLSVAFISCYFIVKDLLSGEKQKLSLKGEAFDRGIVEIAAIVAGLFYIFSPILINSGWDKAILAHIQVFLNPLMFLLLLRYFTTRNILYLLGLLLITFIFSLNFSYAAAPPIFAFYPISILFLFLYTKYIRRTLVPIKGLAIGGVIFVFLNVFHLIPHLSGIFSFEGDVSASVFSEQTKLSRGLDYFTAIAPSVKVSVGLLGLAQLREITLISLDFIIFPTIIILGFIWSRSKTLLLTGVFFLVVTFFATASITDIGFNFYQALFYIPGFKMFRNFFAQWSFVQVFFYTLLFGQALAVALVHFKKIYRYALIIFVLFILTLTAWPLITGEFTNGINWESKNVKVTIKMDPLYEQVLQFVRNDPSDGKFLLLPLSGPGYQVLSGKDGGAYVGQPTFSYLAGKSDFSSYDSFGPYGEDFLIAAKLGDYELIKKLLSLFNIRYIFHNSDPKIYNDNFSGFPYNYVTQFLPKDQESYKKFIEQLPIDKKIHFGENYHFYQISENVYLPHIFTTTTTIYTNDPLRFQLVKSFNKERRSAVMPIGAVRGDSSGIFLEAENTNSLSNLLKDPHFHRHSPFLSVAPSEVYYPFILWREKFDLWRARNKADRYVDLSLLQLSKRVAEIGRWGNYMTMLKSEWKEPKLWEFYRWNTYNSWEASFVLYEKQVKDLLLWIDNSNQPDDWKETARTKLREQLYQHHLGLITAIKGYRDKKEEDKKYILSLTNTTLTNFLDELNKYTYDPTTISYTLGIPPQQQGVYVPYIENVDGLLDNSYIDMNGQMLHPLQNQSETTLLQFDPIGITEQKEKEVAFNLHIPARNIINDIKWKSSGKSKEEEIMSDLSVYNLTSNTQAGVAQDTGLLQEITGWKPNKQYVISFDYQTLGNDFIFTLYERSYKTDEKKSFSSNPVIQRLLNSSMWKSHQLVATSAINAEYAIIQFSGSNEKATSNIYIKNLQVIEIPDPKIYFKKITSDQHKQIAPRIIFTKINPTKYKIDVKEAKNPYVLVFLEAYDNKWRLLTNTTKDRNDIRSKIARFASMVGAWFFDIFLNDKEDTNRISLSHFNGEVMEGMHDNVFLEPRTFETWGKYFIDENKHFRVNGYANGWYIEPGDMNGEENYTLILEMSTQKQFYLLLPLSLLTAIFLFLFFLSRLLREATHTLVRKNRQET